MSCRDTLTWEDGKRDRKEREKSREWGHVTDDVSWSSSSLKSKLTIDWLSFIPTSGPVMYLSLPLLLHACQGVYPARIVPFWCIAHPPISPEERETWTGVARNSIVTILSQRDSWLQKGRSLIFVLSDDPYHYGLGILMTCQSSYREHRSPCMLLWKGRPNG